MSAGWGIMAPISIFSGFNAWERWYSGFIDLVADIKDVNTIFWHMVHVQQLDLHGKQTADI